MAQSISSRKLLPREFYLRSPEIVARNLLSKLITVRRNGKRLTGRILETEAYLGLNDPASHAFPGLTARNAMLFGPPGFSYIYFIYGMHYCLNFSCMPDGQAGGVLIRALEPIEGVATMEQLRHLPAGASPKLLTGGPGRLCEALGITRATHNDIDVTRPRSILQVLDDGHHPEAIQVTPRIGIRKAADLPLRFVVGSSKLVPRKPRAVV